MPSVILTSAYDELNNYLSIHKVNTNVVRGLVDRVAAEALVGWAVSSIAVTTASEAPFVEAGDVQFAAAVSGTGEYSQNVTWAVSGGLDAATVIDGNGLLTIGADEFGEGVAEHTLTITATSVDNNAVNGTYSLICVTGYFSVTYDSNGGTGTMTDENSPYEDEATVTVAENTFTPPVGYIFDRWVWDNVNPGVSPDPTFAIEGNVTIYALWKATYTMAYDANGGTGTMIDGDSPYEDGAEVVVAANTFTPPTDATFIKWNTAANGSGTDYAPAATLTIGEDTTLYAIWQYAVVEGTLLTDTQLYIEAFSSEDATFTANRGADTSITLTFIEWELGVGAVAGGTVFTLDLAYPVVPAMYLIGAEYTSGDGFSIGLDVKYTNTTFTVRNPSAIVLNGIVNVGAFVVTP